MSRPVRVFKFGGSSLKDADAVRNVANILKQYANERLVVVVSAMGKTTNALETVVESHAAQDGKAFELLSTIKQQHYHTIEALMGAQSQEAMVAVNDAFVEIEWVLEEEPYENYDYMYDQIVSVGELVSSKIVAAYLNQAELPTHWLDARDVVLT
ncbi:MAG: aspartate kinase, partial [Bacteroidetes bacterium]|nr:aspartate kinase [Bacteroidota bacterium]